MENQIVVFELSTEHYGVEIGAVESIIKMQPITRMPHAPSFIEGVTNLRGKVLPVMDLRKRFGLDLRDADKNSRIIVVSVNQTEVGMIVDGVSEVLTIADGAVEPAPMIASTVDPTFITGIAKIDKRLVILLDLGRDISEQKQARRAIRESERHLRALVKAAPLGLHQYELLSDGRLILSGANPAADQILGIDHQGLIGLPIEEAFPMHRETEIPALYRRAALEGIPYSCEQISYQDKQIQGVFEIQAFQTGLSRVAVFFQEITEKKRAEEALRESEERYRLLFSSGKDAVFVYPLFEDGHPGHFTDVNEIACQRLGYTRKELLEKSFFDINSAGISGRSTDLLKTLKQSGQLLATAQHRTKSGKSIPVEVNSRIFAIGDKTMVICSFMIQNARHSPPLLSETCPLDGCGWRGYR